MPTHLPQNQFITNSVPTPPAPSGTDTAGVSPPPDAPAGTISNPALELETTAGSAAALDLTDPPVAAADNLTDCISEIFHYARKLMRGHQGFVLDEAAFMAEVEEVPLFLRDGEHLRRWEA